MRTRASHRPLIVIASVLLGYMSGTPAFAQAPVAVNDAYTTNEDQTLSRTASSNGVRANDDPGGVNNNTLTVFGWSAPSNGRLTSTTAIGGFVYVPNLNFNGVDSFTYQLRD